MLQPANRLTLIDALAPPAGFGLESAAAVTFTLDLRALLAVPAALAFARPDAIATGDEMPGGAPGATVADKSAPGNAAPAGAEPDPAGAQPDPAGAEPDPTTDRTAPGATPHEPIELLHALRSHAGRLTVFCQAGEIALAPSRRVFAFLEQVVIPVVAPRPGGIVHPKVWLLRYESAVGRKGAPRRESRLRVLVSSRNLTFDASWDTVVRLDETTLGAGTSLAAVADLFGGLLASPVGEVADVHRRRVESLSTALRAARFALPEGVEELSAHVLGLTGERPSPLPATSERSLVISPFVSDAFFDSVHPGPVHELVSTPDWLDKLEQATLGKVGDVYVLDDGSLGEPGPEGASTSPEDPGRPLVGLHAKVFAFENGGRARLFLGSANATGAAFTSNVEILLEFAGSAELLGIDRLCDGSGDERGLRDLFRAYKRNEPAPTTDGPAGLDHIRRSISRLHFEGVVEPSGSGWAVTYRSREPLGAPAGTAVHCRPLASPGNRRRIEPDRPLEVRFETTLEALSGFLAFEVAREGDDDSRTAFVVPVPLTGVPEDRERILLRALIGNAERFLRYLLALLHDDPGRVDLLDPIEGVEGDAGAGDAGPLGLPVLEKLLRTMRRDPRKLIGLHPLISDLAADGALPPGFGELWETVHAIALREAEAR